MADPAARLVILGLDGATWDLLDPWIAEGALPSLARLCAEGARGPLRSVYPPGTGPAWSSIATGVNPGKHGVFEFMRRREGSYTLQPVNSTALRRLTLWDILAAEGLRSFLLNVPLTHPPREVAGRMVTGLPTPAGARDTTWPPDFAAEIEALVPGYRVLPEGVYRPGGAAAYLRELREVAGRKSELLSRLIARPDWTLVFQVWNETDMGQHALWHVERQDHPRHDRREAEAAPRPLRQLYQDLDAAIGRTLDALPPATVVAVISDHGHGPLHRLLHANNWLLERGLLAARTGAVSRAKRAAFRAGLTPMTAYLAASRLGLGSLKSRLRWSEGGYGMMRRAFFSYADVDWGRTAAYGLGGGVSGGIYLNVRGREPEGVVEPGAGYERGRDEVAAAFRELADPETGAPLIGEVLRREEIYAGPHLAEAPDLVIVPRDPTVGVFGDFEFSSHRLLESAPPALSAHHRMQGVCILRGPGVKAGGTLDSARLEDVAPTLLHLAGIAPSADMDGRVLAEGLDPEWLAAHPVRSAARPAERGPGGGGGPGTREYSPEEERDIRDRFRDLGYIS